MSATTSSAKCQKFQPNIFNKSKCQHCFKPKEQHSADAIESSKAVRKISKCGYLFVAPDSYDFSNSMDKTRRWQRRFFVLYDDGELTYAVDENVNTIPQCAIDMGICTDICDAEDTTNHNLAIAIMTPDKVTYIKGTSKDEINRWHDVLVMYPRSSKIKHRRSPTYCAPKSEPTKPVSVSKTEASEDATLEPAAVVSSQSIATPARVHAASSSSSSSTIPHHKTPTTTITTSRTPASEPLTFRGVRSLKHRGSSMRRSSSLTELSDRRTDSGGGDGGRADAWTRRRRSQSGDGHPDTTAWREDASPTWSSSGQQETSPWPDNSPRGSQPDHLHDMNGRNKNETDEYKMAKSGEMNTASRSTGRSLAVSSKNREGSPDIHYIKKGWLVRQGADSKDWTKHWFVLSGSMLRYYRDASAEEYGAVDGHIDLSTCHRVTETTDTRYYGFKLESEAGDTVLSAMTTGIRSKWMQVLKDCLAGVCKPNSAGGSRTTSRSTSASSSARSSRSGSVDKTGFTCTWPYRKSEPTSPLLQVTSFDTIRQPPRDDDDDAPSGRSSRSASHDDSLGDVATEQNNHHHRVQHRSITDSMPPPRKRNEMGDTFLSPASRRRCRDSREYRARSMSMPLPADTNDVVNPPAGANSSAVNGGDTAKFRAPSARLKEKSRCKSPRSRSPPPSKKTTPAKETMDGNKVTKENAQAVSAEHTDKIQLLEKQVSSLRDRLTDADAELRSVKKTNAELKVQMTAQSKKQLSTNHADGDMSRLIEKQSSKKDTQLQVSLDELSRLRQQLAAVSSELTTVKAAFDHATAVHRDRVTELLSDAAIADRHKADQEMKLAKQADALAAANVVTGSLKNEMSRLNDSHKAELKRQKDREAELRRLNDSRAAELGKLRSDNESLESRLSSLEAGMRERDETISQFEERLLENTANTDRLTEELSLEMNDSAALRQQLATAESALSHLRESHDKLAVERDTLKCRVNSAEAETSRLGAELKEQHKELDENVDESNTVTRLKQELAAMEASYEEQVSHLSERARDLAMKLSAAERRVRRLDRRSAGRYQSTGSEPECDASKNETTDVQKLTWDLSVCQHAAQASQRECVALREARTEDAPRLSEALRRLRHAETRIDACRESLKLAVTSVGEHRSVTRTHIDRAIAALAQSAGDDEQKLRRLAAERLAMEAAVQDAMARSVTCPAANRQLQQIQLASHHVLRLRQQMAIAGDVVDDSVDKSVLTNAVLLADKLQLQQQLSESLADVESGEHTVADRPASEVNCQQALLKVQLDCQMPESPVLTVGARSIVQTELNVLLSRVADSTDGLSAEFDAAQQRLAKQEEDMLCAVEEYRLRKISEISSMILADIPDVVPDRDAAVRDALRDTEAEFRGLFTQYVVLWEERIDEVVDDISDGIGVTRRHHLLRESTEFETKHFVADLLQQCTSPVAPPVANDGTTLRAKMLELASALSQKAIVATILTCVNEAVKSSSFDLQGEVSMPQVTNQLAVDLCTNADAKRRVSSDLMAGSADGRACRLAMRVVRSPTSVINPECSYQAQLAYASFCAAVKHRRELADEQESAEHERLQLFERHAQLVADLERQVGNLERQLQERRQQVSDFESRVTALQSQLCEARYKHQTKGDGDGAKTGARRRTRERCVPDVDAAAGSASQKVLSSRLEQMQDQFQNMQADYEQELSVLKSSHKRELARSKDDMMMLLAAAEENSLQVNEEGIRKRYMKEVDKIKALYDKGFTVMEKSHQKVLTEVHHAHKREMDLLRQEKDLLLQEETKATQSALDAMRNAHEAELQAERNKFLDVITKTYSRADVEALQKLHEEDLELIQDEIRQLSEQYSVKALESAHLEERLEAQTKMLHQSRCRVQDLSARNEELNTRLKHEIERLNRLVQSDRGGFSGDSDAQVAGKIKDAEIQQLKDEVSCWKNQLQDTVQELEDSMELYHDLYTEHTQLKRRYEHDVEEMREKLARSPAAISSGVATDDDDEDAEAQPSAMRGCSPIPSTDVDALLLEPPPPKGKLSGKLAKRQSWRMKNPERARSSPGLSASPSETTPDRDSNDTPTPAGGKPKMQRGDRSKTTIGINVIEQL